MSKASSHLLFACLLFLFVGQIDCKAKYYCIANPKATTRLIQEKMDFCCGQIPESCDLVQAGQPCYVQDDLRATASYVFDDWYHGGCECDFDGAEIRTETDPSHGNCTFQGRDYWPEFNNSNNYACARV